MFEVKSVEEIFKIINTNFFNYILDEEIIPIEECLDRVLASDIYSQEDIPHFNKSSVDGYAVNSLDTLGASENNPIQLLKKGEIKIGEKANIRLNKGESIYIPTGGEIPDGADSIVMIEYTTDYEDEFIYINKSLSSGENIIYKGDDFKKGEIIFNANKLLKNKDIIILASLGIKKVKVKRRLKIGIISTGDELIEIEEKIKDSKVRDINSYSIFSTFNYNTFENIRYGIIKDDFSEIKKIIEKALQETDVIILSGGSSVGLKDLSLNVINSFNKSEILCYGIAIKPGKPTIIAKIESKPIIVLPGHPLSCFMILNFFITYLLENILGIKNKVKESIQAIVTEDYPSNIGRAELIPVILSYENKNYFATPLLNKSGLISTISKASGFIYKEREIEGLKKNEIVNVILF